MTSTKKSHGIKRNNNRRTPVPLPKKKATKKKAKKASKRSESKPGKSKGVEMRIDGAMYWEWLAKQNALREKLEINKRRALEVKTERARPEYTALNLLETALSESASDVTHARTEWDAMMRTVAEKFGIGAEQLLAHEFVINEDTGVIHFTPAKE